MFSANTSQVSDDKLFVEDVFSTYLYTGNGSTQTIVNGIDLAGKGGLVWIKARGANGQGHNIFDTARGTLNVLFTNNNLLAQSAPNTLTSFNNNGFSIGSSPQINFSPDNFASWTFRKAPKFFDVVTWTGTSGFRSLSHALGTTPGCIIFKRTDAADNWFVWHRTRTGAPPPFACLNLTDAFDTGVSTLIPGVPTDTIFSVGNLLNASGATYVAYLFAHDTTSDGIIQCGSFTTDGSGNASAVTLGWEPQWLTIKASSTTSDWLTFDNMRGWTAGGSAVILRPNSANAESSNNGVPFPNATGFGVQGLAANATYVYIAIRRGPMRTPTSGTSVFAVTSNSPSSAPGYVSNFPVDFSMMASRTTTDKWYQASRLAGNAFLNSASTSAETSASSFSFAYQNGWYNNFGLGSDYYSWMFRRAPSFFDVVCYTGTGVARTINHNLGVAPELMIVKQRNISTQNWGIYHKDVGNTKGLFFDTATPTTNSGFWNNTTPTASVFSLGNFGVTNGGGGYTYVAYLFASCPGVSKVGSYTGNGSSQTINCGFAAGARFVMIKRTDSTGDWYVWDSARGIVAGNDPRLSLNSTAAEVTTDDSVDTDSSGFVVNQLSATNINVSSATYIYLAVA